MLEIFQQSVINLNTRGVQVNYFQKGPQLVLLLSGVYYCPHCGNFRLFEQMDSEVCQHCTEAKP